MKTSQTIAKEYRCRDCTLPYTLNEQQIEWFIIRGLNLPARCPACLAERRRLRDAEDEAR